jgi:ATP-dependent 26S proteasome regulatory subunit
MLVNNGWVVVATANDPKRLDPAIKSRPGRFDQVIELPNPDATLRFRYLSHLFRKLTIEPKDMDVLVQETEGMSMAFLKEVFVVAATKGLTENGIVITSEVVRHTLNQILEQYGGVGRTRRAGFGD